VLYVEVLDGNRDAVPPSHVCVIVVAVFATAFVGGVVHETDWVGAKQVLVPASRV